MRLLLWLTIFISSGFAWAFQCYRQSAVIFYSIVNSLYLPIDMSITFYYSLHRNALMIAITQCAIVSLQLHCWLRSVCLLFFLSNSYDMHFPFHVTDPTNESCFKSIVKWKPTRYGKVSEKGSTRRICSDRWNANGHQYDDQCFAEIPQDIFQSERQIISELE